MEESRKNRRKEIEKKVVDLFSSATPKIPRRKKAADTTVSVRGNRNIVAGDNNIINNFSAPPVITRTVIVKTGDGVLTAEQKGAINKTIEDWAGKRNAVRRSRVEIAALRKAFNRYMSVNSYHEIHQEHFEKAMKWLRRQIGIINRMPGARRSSATWRKDRYRAIHARAGEYPDGELRFRRYAEERFGCSSLKDLSDDELETVYNYVFGW